MLASTIRGIPVLGFKLRFIPEPGFNTECMLIYVDTWAACRITLAELANNKLRPHNVVPRIAGFVEGLLKGLAFGAPGDQ